MAQTETQKVQTKSLAYIAICIGGILIFLLIFILPNQRKMAELDIESQDLMGLIEKQKVLAPIYKKLLQELNVEYDRSLPFPEQTELGRQKIGTITAVFSEIARRNSLSVKQMSPDFNSITNDAGQISVNARLSGDFLDFREFLIDLAGVSYLRGVDDIQIRAEPGMKHYKLRFSLALSK